MAVAFFAHGLVAYLLALSIAAALDVVFDGKDTATALRGSIVGAISDTLRALVWAIVLTTLVVLFACLKVTSPVATADFAKAALGGIGEAWACTAMLVAVLRGLYEWRIPRALRGDYTPFAHKFEDHQDGGRS